MHLESFLNATKLTLNVKFIENMVLKVLPFRSKPKINNSSFIINQ